MMLTALLLAAAEPETAIDAERAFAKDAQELGQWMAFAKWADDEAVLVGRTLIPAKSFAAEAAADEPAIAIGWWPIASIVSCDGSLAFNYGAYYSPLDGTYGRFNTVWKKTDKGWRYVLDMGTEESAPLPVPSEVVPVIADCDIPEGESGQLNGTTVGKSSDGTLQYQLAKLETGHSILAISYWSDGIWVRFAELKAPE